jgi:hypothetical protein
VPAGNLPPAQPLSQELKPKASLEDEEVEAEAICKFINSFNLKIVILALP